MIDRLTEALSDRYRIERELGAGGMATVYLADDLKHDRKVAIKVLRPELAAVVGAERFLSEIRTTANLQHPHILPLFDSGEAGGFLYYVMPYMAGETLRDRIDREKQLPVDEAVAIATKVSSALAYAHRNGVIHRDIKPANILLEDGEPQVADFGIALAVQQAGGGRLTETGLSLGTPYYMSPEQATGDRDPDPRSDMYSLGCVAYEMLAGEPPFIGTTAQSVLAKILTEDAPLITAVRRAVPLHVASAIARATQRLPADRFPDVAGFISALNDPSYRYGELARAGAGLEGSSANGAPWRIATAALAMLSVGLGALLATRGGAPAEFEPLTLRIMMPDSQRILNPPDYLSAMLSDDGSTLVYIGPEFPSGEQLWVKRRTEANAVPIRGTSFPMMYAVSPDGSEVAFVQQGDPVLRVVATAGGSPRAVADSASVVGGDWGPDGYIYFQNLRSGISRVRSTGGAVELLVAAADVGDRDLTWPSWLPGERFVLMTRWGNTPASDSIAVLDMESGVMRTIALGVRAEYAHSGHLLISTNDQSVSFVPFDPELGEVTAPPRQLLGEVRSLLSGALDFQLGASGSLLYVSGGGRRSRPVWVDRQGGVTQIQEDWREDFGGFALTRDGSRIAVAVTDGARSDIWTRSSAPGDFPPQRMTFRETDINRPTWSPAGDTIFHVGALEGAGSTQILGRRADGTGDATVVIDVDEVGSSQEVQDVEVSTDGEWFVYRVGGGVASRDIMVKQRGVDSVGRPLIAEAFNEHSPMISPDGRFLVYGSNESGEEEIYVRTFPDILGGKWVVSSNGGTEPVWSRDGSRIFYRDRSRRMVEAVWSDAGGVTAREVLFDAREFLSDPVHPAYDVHPDGRFLMGELADNPEIGIVWVENFIQQLRRGETGR